MNYISIKMVLKNECIYPSIFLKTSYTGFCYCHWLPPMLNSSSLSSPSIHSKIAKSWLMNDPVLELPRHIVHVTGSVRKIMPKIKIHPKCYSSCASAPSPHTFRLPIILWGWMLIVVSGIIILKMTLWMIPSTSNSLRCGWDWQKRL